MDQRLLLIGFSVYQYFNISETDTVRNIMNEFSLSQEEAVNYVKKYW